MPVPSLLLILLFVIGDNQFKDKYLPYAYPLTPLYVTQYQLPLVLLVSTVTVPPGGIRPICVEYFGDAAGALLMARYCPFVLTTVALRVVVETVAAEVVKDFTSPQIVLPSTMAYA